MSEDSDIVEVSPPVRYQEPRILRAEDEAPDGLDERVSARSRLVTRVAHDEVEIDQDNSLAMEVDEVPSPVEAELNDMDESSLGQNEAGLHTPPPIGALSQGSEILAVPRPLTRIRGDLSSAATSEMPLRYAKRPRISISDTETSDVPLEADEPSEIPAQYVADGTRAGDKTELAGQQEDKILSFSFQILGNTRDEQHSGVRLIWAEDQLFKRFPLPKQPDNPVRALVKKRWPADSLSDTRGLAQEIESLRERCFKLLSEGSIDKETLMHSRSYSDEQWQEEINRSVDCFFDKDLVEDPSVFVTFSPEEVEILAYMCSVDLVIWEASAFSVPFGQDVDELFQPPPSCIHAHSTSALGRVQDVVFLYKDRDYYDILEPVDMEEQELVKAKEQPQVQPQVQPQDQPQDHGPQHEQPTSGLLPALPSIKVISSAMQGTTIDGSSVVSSGIVRQLRPSSASDNFSARALYDLVVPSIVGATYVTPHTAVLYKL